MRFHTEIFSEHNTWRKQSRPVKISNIMCQLAHRVLVVLLCGIVLVGLAACGGGGGGSGSGGGSTSPALESVRHLFPRTAPTSAVLDTPDPNDFDARRTAFEDAEYRVDYVARIPNSLVGIIGT
ncbi:MAG: hypothetical protein ACR2P7_05605, partial [bacterium]